MQQLSHSELNEHQLAQVNYLFADSIFGTNAAAFVYELKNGDVKGRTLASSDFHRRAKQDSPIKVTAVEEVNITDEIIRHANMSMDALAASVAEHFYQSQSTQPIEVENP